MILPRWIFQNYQIYSIYEILYKKKYNKNEIDTPKELEYLYEYNSFRYLCYISFLIYFVNQIFFILILKENIYNYYLKKRQKQNNNDIKNRKKIEKECHL